MRGVISPSRCIITQRCRPVNGIIQRKHRKCTENSLHAYIIITINTHTVKHVSRMCDWKIEMYNYIRMHYAQFYILLLST